MCVSVYRGRGPGTAGGPDHNPASSIERMQLERSMHDQFLSNTYLVGQEGGEAFFVDAGGPVGPLIHAAERHEMTATHVLLTHRHHDHVAELAKLTERWPQMAVLAPP